MHGHDNRETVRHRQRGREEKGPRVKKATANPLSHLRISSFCSHSHPRISMPLECLLLLAADCLLLVAGRCLRSAAYDRRPVWHRRLPVLCAFALHCLSQSADDASFYRLSHRATDYGRHASLGTAIVEYSERCFSCVHAY